MKKSVLLTSVLLFLSLFLYAQNDNLVNITGSILEASTKEPVGQAGVRILSAKDSSYVVGTATNSTGKFNVRVKPGSYIAHISFLGYADVYAKINATKEQNILGEVLLKDDAILLAEAIVTAKAREIVVRGDTVEYNADSYKVQESAVLEDLVKKMPGAEIDADGKITINGKEIKKILVDGKEFFSDDPKVASKNLPAKMIEKLQVLDRKTDMSQMTGFDDGEEETVINLTVKPGMKEGAFGNAYAGYGNRGRYEVNGMANYMRNNNQLTVLGGSNNTNNAGFSDFASTSFSGMRRPRGLSFGGNNGISKSTNAGINIASELSPSFKMGGDIRYGRTDNDVISDSYTQYYNRKSQDSTRYETKHEWGNNIGDNFNTSLRFEWKVDSATQVIFKPNFRYNKNDNYQTDQYLTTFANPNDTINWGSSTYNSRSSGINLNGELEVSRKLGNKGRVLSFSLTGGLSNSDSDGFNYSETNFKNMGEQKPIDQIFDQKNTGYNMKGFVSYVEPIGRNNFLQLTYSYRKNYSDSDKMTYRNEDGSYAVVDSAYSKTLKSNFINQEAQLNLKSVREKYNYTIGIGVQPSNSESKTTYYGKDERSIKNNVLNFSPNMQYNYIWNKRTNLRIDYRGVTSQASTSQLLDVLDISNPLNLTLGNPNLKPSFENRLSVRYRQFNPEKASAFMVFARMSYTLDDIANYSLTDTIVHYQGDSINLFGGKRLTQYKNVDGNMSANLRVIYNKPLRNKKFSLNSMSFVSFARSNGYVQDEKNTQNTYRLQESLGLEYRSSIFDAGIRGNFTYNNIKNSSQQDGQETYNYGGNVNTTIYLPLSFTVESDMNYAANSGYSSGFSQNEWLWNASVSKLIFKAKNGTIRFKIYDILQQRSNVSRSSSTEYTRDVITNSLESYFMFHFIYKFQIFKGGAKASDMNNQQSGPGFGGGGGHPPRM